MAAFSYKAATLEGKIVEGTMEAPDNGAVALKLQDMGLLPIRVVGAARKSVLAREIELPWKRKKIRHKHLLVFTQELHTMLRSGIPLDRSLSVLAQLAENPALAEVIEDVLKRVKGGKSFSEAIGEYPEVFPRVYVNMVRAGEVGGALDEVLARLIGYLESSENLRTYVIGALIYPALLSVVGVASITIMTLFVVPRFAAVFQDMGVPLPLPMAILKGLSTFLIRFWWLLVTAVFLVAAYLRRFRNTPEGRLKIDRWALKLPMWGGVVRKIEVARFARTLGTLLHGGVPLLQAMTIVKEVVANQGIATMVDPIRNGIKKGEGISQPMKQSGVFPPLAMHLIEVGEESGKLDSMLVQVADVYDSEVRNAIKNLIAFFEPALILTMGVIIGTIVVSMMLAIFSINEVPL
jgi:general secretion pathway protein F